jgi:hypothetical protein
MRPAQIRARMSAWPALAGASIADSQAEKQNVRCVPDVFSGLLLLGPDFALTNLYRLICTGTFAEANKCRNAPAR